VLENTVLCVVNGVLEMVEEVVRYEVALLLFVWTGVLFVGLLVLEMTGVVALVGRCDCLVVAEVLVSSNGALDEILLTSVVVELVVESVDVILVAFGLLVLFVVFFSAPVALVDILEVTLVVEVILVIEVIELVAVMMFVVPSTLQIAMRIAAIKVAFLYFESRAILTLVVGLTLRV